jgi:hypothetical protein
MIDNLLYILMGINELVRTDPANLASYFDRLFAGQWKKGTIPPLWDGKTGQRIVAYLAKAGVKKSGLIFPESWRQVT